MKTAHLYTAGFGNADPQLILKSAVIAAILIALAIVVSVLVISKDKK